MRVIAVANQKGGCGKTTTSINFAAGLAFLDKKTLLIDLDPQGHSTCGLGIRSSHHSGSLYDLLTPCRGFTKLFADVVCEIAPNFYLLPAYGSLGALEEELVHFPDREKKLKRILTNPEIESLDFDYVVLDCPPNLGMLTYNALEAADEMMIPIEPSFFSLHGLAKMSETVQTLNQNRYKTLEVRALLTIFNSNTRFAEEVFEEVKAHFGPRLFKTIIHENVLLKEAASAGQSILDYDPGHSSGAARDYVNLATEYLECEWDRMLPETRLGWQQILHEHYGPRKVPGGVLFQALSKTARWVEIAGDFNNWVPETLVKRNGEGLWQKVIPLNGGGCRYKFIVDGEWQVDPYQPVQLKNEFGTFDSFLEFK